MQRVLILIIMTVCFFLVGCNSCSTNPKTGSISGKVILINDTGNPQQDPVDFSGVTVAVYELAQLDTSLVRLNHKYPQSGIPINQETEFDHREFDPITTVTTDAEGIFIIENLNAGEYNVVTTKEGWSVKYVYSVLVNEGSEVSLPNIQMYGAIYISQFVADPIIFKTDRMYVFSEDTNVYGDVQIEAGSHMVVTPGKTARFYGNISCPDAGWWRVDTYYSIYSTQMINIEHANYYYALIFYNASCTVKNMLACHAENAIIVNSEIVALNHCYFKNNGLSVEVSQANTTISNTVFKSGYGIAVRARPFGNPVSINHSIFAYNSTGIDLISQSSIIENCYFLNNDRAVVSQESHGSIQHCEFDRNNFDISIATSCYNVVYNDFYYSTYKSVVPGSFSQTEQTIVNNNNFFATDDVFISIRSERTPYSTVYQDLDATNNYWLPNDIDSYILDAGDNFLYPNAPCPRSIIYIPKRISMVLTAGIQ